MEINTATKFLIGLPPSANSTNQAIARMREDAGSRGIALELVKKSLIAQGYP